MVKSKINDQIQEENKIVKLMQDQKEGQDRIEKTLEEQKGKQEQMNILIETQQENQRVLGEPIDSQMKLYEDKRESEHLSKMKLFEKQKTGQERIETILENQKQKQEQMSELIEHHQEEQKEISKAMDENIKTIEDRLTPMESYDYSDYHYVEQTGQDNQTNEINVDKDGANVKCLPCKCGRLIKIIHTMKTKEKNGNSREETWEHNYNTKWG